MKPLFLISLPRSGSTLIQRVLSSHNDIYTVSEPWILLPYLYTLKTTGCYSEYNHSVATTAIEDFCQELPNGREDYLAEISSLALRLYRKATKKDVTYFLDKTPRYTIIVNDLIKMFPEAKFIFLWRNPLSVISSMIESWAGGRWNIYAYKIDLFAGMENMINTFERHAHKIYSIKYEDFITAPEKKWQNLCGYLNIRPTLEPLTEFRNTQLRGRWGDSSGKEKYDMLSKEPLEKWRKVLGSPIRKWWCRKYIRWIGQDRLQTMGYDLEELLNDLDSIPTTYRFFVSDVTRLIYGIIYCFDSNIFEQKIQQLPKFKYIYTDN